VKNRLLSPYLERINRFYDSAPTESSYFARSYRRLLAHYYQLLIPRDASIVEVGCGSGELLEFLPHKDVTGIDISEKQLARARERIPHGTFYMGAVESLVDEGKVQRKFDYIILSDFVNLCVDVQTMFEKIQELAGPSTRLILNTHNSVWHPILQLAGVLGWKTSPPITNWLSSSDVQNLLELSDWEIIYQECRMLIPVKLFGLEKLVNRFLAPFFPFLCHSIFQIARPRPLNRMAPQSVSVVIPARNEAGNIEAAVQRIPMMGSSTEIVFIEGHSRDDTWERIRQAAANYPHRQIKIMRQTGKGKGNAVREAFDASSGEILMILDADLTVPPEDLPKFYEALVSRRTEFANGVRLVYPMADKAMRFLNMCANKFFSSAFTWILGRPIKDTLCGTKALFRQNYQKIAANRQVFGDFDPFGDFDLLFGARKLNLKIIDIPVRYRERTYGETNINRWSHGALLIRMVLFSLTRIKMV